MEPKGQSINSDRLRTSWAIHDGTDLARPWPIDSRFDSWGRSVSNRCGNRCPDQANSRSVVTDQDSE
jgi:hypothetical protein